MVSRRQWGQSHMFLRRFFPQVTAQALTGARTPSAASRESRSRGRWRPRSYGMRQAAWPEELPPQELRTGAFASRRGAVLLEVLIALTLFVFAATVIVSSLNSGVERVARLKAQLHAEDLAVSVLSEVKLGMLPMESQGPEPFNAPFDQWTWQVEATPYAYGSGDASADVSALQLVTVIVKNNENTAAQWLTEILSPPGGTQGLDSPSGVANDSSELTSGAANGVFGP